MEDFDQKTQQKSQNSKNIHHISSNSNQIPYANQQQKQNNKGNSINNVYSKILKSMPDKQLKQDYIDYEQQIQRKNSGKTSGIHQNQQQQQQQQQQKQNQQVIKQIQNLIQQKSSDKITPVSNNIEYINKQQQEKQKLEQTKQILFNQIQKKYQNKSSHLNKNIQLQQLQQQEQQESNNANDNSFRALEQYSNNNNQYQQQQQQSLSQQPSQQFVLQKQYQQQLQQQLQEPLEQQYSNNIYMSSSSNQKGSQQHINYSKSKSNNFMSSSLQSLKQQSTNNTGSLKNSMTNSLQRFSNQQQNNQQDNIMFNQQKCSKNINGNENKQKQKQREQMRSSEHQTYYVQHQQQQNNLQQQQQKSQFQEYNEFQSKTPKIAKFFNNKSFVNVINKVIYGDQNSNNSHNSSHANTSKNLYKYNKQKEKSRSNINTHPSNFNNNNNNGGCGVDKKENNNNNLLQQQQIYQIPNPCKPIKLNDNKKNNVIDYNSDTGMCDKNQISLQANKLKNSICQKIEQKQQQQNIQQNQNSNNSNISQRLAYEKQLYYEIKKKNDGNTPRNINQNQAMKTSNIIPKPQNNNNNLKQSKQKTDNIISNNHMVSAKSSSYRQASSYRKYSRQSVERKRQSLEKSLKNSVLKESSLIVHSEKVQIKGYQISNREKSNTVELKHHTNNNNANNNNNLFQTQQSNESPLLKKKVHQAKPKQFYENLLYQMDKSQDQEDSSFDNNNFALKYYLSDSCNQSPLLKRSSQNANTNVNDGRDRQNNKNNNTNNMMGKIPKHNQSSSSSQNKKIFSPIRVSYNNVSKCKKSQNSLFNSQENTTFLKNQQLLPYQQQDQIKLQDFQIQNILGTGAYAQVRLVKYLKDQCLYAMKIYSKNQKEEEKKKQINKEIQILQQLRHQNVLKYYHKIETRDQIYLIMEYVGDLHLQKYISNQQKIKKQPISTQQIRQIFLEIALGIQYLHQKNIVHRDIKLQNIIITNNNENSNNNFIQQQQQAKLIDFGFATQIINDQNHRLNFFCGTPQYMAPELVSKQQYHGPPVDIWAFGVMLYKIVTNQFPFPGQNDKELFKQIVNDPIQFPQAPCQYWDIVSDMAFQDLILNSLQKDPKKRYNIQQILSHQWLQQQQQ